MAQAKRPKSEAGEPRAGDQSTLEIGEDLAFQRRDWRTQRIGWGALTVLLLAALLGLTGSGPLSHVTKSNGRGLSVEYERFVRHGARTATVVEVPAGILAGAQARITIGLDYLAAFDVHSMAPEPDSMEVGGNDVTFVFITKPHAGLKWRMSLEPDELGRHATRVRLDDGPSVEISQFTLP